MVDNGDNSTVNADQSPSPNERHSRLDAFGAYVCVGWIFAMWLVLVTGPSPYRFLWNWLAVISGPFRSFLFVVGWQIDLRLTIVIFDLVFVSLLVYLVFATPFGKIPRGVHWAIAFGWCLHGCMSSLSL